MRHIARGVHPLVRQALTLLLGYVLGFVLVLTLAPFDFSLDAAKRIVLIESAREAAINLALFVPVGILIALRAGRRWPLAKALIGGGLASLTIECLQLLLPARLTSVTDLVANTLGAGTGGALAWMARRWLDEHVASLRVLELPSINVLYLLLPLVWLAYLRPAGTHERLVLAVILTATAAGMIGALWRYQLGPAARMPLAGIGVVASLWALLANGLGFRYAPQTTLAIAVASALGAWLVATLPGRGWHRGRRFEGVVLMLGAAGLATYWLANLGLPSLGWTTDWSMVAGWPSRGFNRDISYSFAEAVASLSAAGYVLSALAARRRVGDATALFEASVRQRLADSALLLSPGLTALLGCGLLGLVYETVHGFHANDAASVMRLTLGLGGAAIGIALHKLQLRAIVEPRPSPRRPGG